MPQSLVVRRAVHHHFPCLAVALRKQLVSKRTCPERSRPLTLVIALIGLTTPDTSGMIGLAPVFGWLLLIPGLFGAIALVRMRQPTQSA